MIQRPLLATTIGKCSRKVKLTSCFCSSAKPDVDEKRPTRPWRSPEYFEVDGIRLAPDGNWNIPSTVLKMLDRKLLSEKDNPLSLLKRHIVDHVQMNYRKSGNRSPLFTVCETEPRVVSTWDNFDSLLTPEDHVSRRLSDTYYVNKNYCLRGHTSAHQHKLIKQGLDNFLVVGDVYRRDEINRTHYPCFHQIEGVRLYSSDQLFTPIPGNKVPLFENGERTREKQESHTTDTANVLKFKLQEMLEKLCSHIFNAKVEMRWVDAYFPFTHPSFELEMFYEGKWMEMLGCGIIEQKLLESAGVFDKVGWAFGLGLERIAMVLYGIPDIRLFWSRDSGFLSQFAGKQPNDRFKYRPISVHPQVLFDISFWLPDGVVPEEMTANTYDLIRNVGGELIEQVNLMDSFKSKKTGQLSQTYHLVYRSNERALTKDEVNIVHKQIERELTDRYRVRIR